jgi:hypothetical protein
MATVTPARPFNRAEADRRVRHPLQAVRGSIRRYVTLEGLSLTVLYLALWFWIGMALDYGTFYLLHFDWIKELDRGASETASFWTRAFLLALLAGGLAFVVVSKVVRRLTREFSDPAIALLLERRFPRELGDRLITAVEMADPTLAAKYGFSQDMLDKTIRDAADRVERLPVHEVFNWARLYWRMIWAGVALVGTYIVVAITCCIVAAAQGGSANPLDFFFRFNYVASTWVERDVFLQSHRYWLGNEFLTVPRFPRSGELRVARDEARPDVQIHGVRWILADRGPDAPEGWRALRWSDLAPRGLVDAALLQKVQLPRDFPGWRVDLDDLDPSLPLDVIPADWGWQDKSAGAVREDVVKRRQALDATKKGIEKLDKKLAQQQEALEGKDQGPEAGEPKDPPGPPPKVDDEAREQLARGRRDLDRARKSLENQTAQLNGAVRALDGLLDWQRWTVDKLQEQLRRSDVYTLMRDPQRAAEKSPSEAALEDVLSKLAELADSARMYGTLRRLDIPKTITVVQRGEVSDTENLTTVQRHGGYKFTFSLDKLTESVKFYAGGEEYSTRVHTVTLVPPPSLTHITTDTEEPAYLHYRLLGSEAGKLRGQRQHLRGVLADATGPSTVILVPVGTNLTVRATANRDLKEDTARVIPPSANQRKEPGSITPPAEVKPAGKRAFSVQFENVRRTIEFLFEFRDADNVLGQRHVLIKPIGDRAPELTGVKINAVLRPDYDPETAKGAPARAGERLLITPDALIPFAGKISDDRGLTRLEFKYKLVPLPFQRIGVIAAESKGAQELPPAEPDKAIAVRAALIVRTLQFTPASLGNQWALPAQVATLYEMGKSGQVFEKPQHGAIEMEKVKARLEQFKNDDVTFEEMQRLLQLQPRNRADAARLIDLQGAAARQKFQEELTEAQHLEPLLRDMLHFLKVDEAERNRLRPQIATNPGLVLQRLVEIANANPEETKRTLELLKKRPETMLLREYLLENENGFDVQAHLPAIKAGDGEKQKHYELHLYVVATDNNVETGPTKGPEKGPFVFLVVSERELLAEMIRQEKQLHDLLKKAVDELDDARTEMDTELSLRLTGTGDPRLDNIAARVDTSRKAVQKVGSIAKVVLEKYKHIVREMEVNRIGGERYQKVMERIVAPLIRLTEKNTGDVAFTEEVVTNFLTKLEEDYAPVKKLKDVEEKKRDNKALDKLIEELEKRRPVYQAEAGKTSKTVLDLTNELRNVLEAIRDTIEPDKLIAILVEIEARQREMERIVRAEYRRIEEIFEREFGDLEEKTPPKGKDKEKK